MSEALSHSELRSLFAGLDLTSGVAAQRAPEPTAEVLAEGDQFLLPVTLDLTELTAAQQWQSGFLSRWKQTLKGPSLGPLTFQCTDLRVVRLRDFVAEHDSNHRYLANSTELELPVWLALDEALVGAHLDCLLGAGDFAASATGQRHHGPLEHQLTGRLVDSICQALEKPITGRKQGAWQFKRANSQADWIAEVPIYLSTELFNMECEVTFAGTTGRLSLGIPRRQLSRFAPLPCQSLRGPFATNDAQPDHGAEGATVTLRATLDPITLTANEFSQLQVGDVLLTSQCDLAPCIVTWGAAPRFRATIGQNQNRKAVQLTTPLE